MDELQNTLHITNPFTQEQIQEGVSRWPLAKKLQTCLHQGLEPGLGQALHQALQRASLFQTLQHQIQTTDVKETSKHLQTIQNQIQTLQPLLRPSTTTESEGYSQVCFQGTPWSGLNAIPFALMALSVYKSYIVPSFAILLPLVSWIVPFLLLKSFFGINISFSQYTSILWRMWNGQPLPKTPEELLQPAPEVQTDMISQIKRLGQNGWTLFTIGQALYQPIQQARHFRKLDSECLLLGESILQIYTSAKALLSTWKSFLPTWFSNWLDLCPSDARQAFAFVIDFPFWLPHLLRALGRFDLLFTLASRSDVHPVQFIQNRTPVLCLKEFGDPAIPFERRVMSSILLDESTQQHAIVTGPNRGGKSSFMRGVLMNVKLAHAFGCCFAQKAQMTPFTWIADGLKLDDLPGQESMFEREVKFAKGVLDKSNEPNHGLVLYDELFHSTNPPDATRTSNLFCSSLWKSKHCVSLVSTHVYSLAHQAPPNVKRICLAAWKLPTGKYKFSYKAQKGVCEVSSVDLLLQQYGLLSAE
jgi:hypothetical protein